ncbi:hypothetical protein H8356DRAFT_1082415 [Neocallimastix lanati (nom. inval.)]|nr:hypothetical protein H8356DRAFT_1082415 [Neocallimastix sp. JGI-2020a]
MDDFTAKLKTYVSPYINMGVCLTAILVQQKNSNIEVLYVILKGKQSHHSTNCTITNLISEIGKDPVFSSVIYDITYIYVIPRFLDQFINHMIINQNLSQKL